MPRRFDIADYSQRSLLYVINSANLLSFFFGETTYKCRNLKSYCTLLCLHPPPTALQPNPVTPPHLPQSFKNQSQFLHQLDYQSKHLFGEIEKPTNPSSRAIRYRRAFRFQPETTLLTRVYYFNVKRPSLFTSVAVHFPLFIFPSRLEFIALLS